MMPLRAHHARKDCSQIDHEEDSFTITAGAHLKKMRSRSGSQHPGISAPRISYKTNAALGRGCRPKVYNRQTQEILLAV